MTVLDDIERADCGVKLELKFLKLTGGAFQDFFSDVMERCHGSDFTRVKPWGSDGDDKCDGYWRSDRRLFGVFAPEDMDEKAKTLKKINEDHAGAVAHWKAYIDHWTLVHNQATKGLPPHVLTRLLELHDPSGISVSHWGLPEIRTLVLSLDRPALITLLGVTFVNRTEMQRVRMEDVGPVLRSIAAADCSPDHDVRPVPKEKLAANNLSADAAELFRAGMPKSQLVKDAFESHPDPAFSEQIVAAFKRQYEALRDMGLQPDDIFAELRTFAGASATGTPRHECAVLAVLAYLFETCHIFERPAEL